MYKNNQLCNRYFPRSQRISYRYRETPRCSNIYIIDLNQFLLLFMLTINKHKYFSSSPKLFFFITLSLNLPRSLWFVLGTPRIILLQSLALVREQAFLVPLPGSCYMFRGNFWEQSTTGGNSSIGNFVPFFPLFCFYFFCLFLIYFVWLAFIVAWTFGLETREAD